MQIFDRFLERLEDALHLAGCLALVAVAVIINADIVMRLVAARPVQIQFELTELYLMPALATLSLSRVFREGGHLALEFGPETLPGVWGGLLRRARLLLPAAFFAAVTAMSGTFAYQALHHGAVEYGVIDWPLGWAYAVVPLGCGVLVLRLVRDAARDAPAADRTRH